MTCHDARERLSDLVDDALAAAPRAELDAHLAGCADCRRELERIRATVSLLRAVERPRAPAGFVQRVVEAARPAPWHRRLLDRLAAVRLLRFPVEAAAVVLVASLAVYVFQETPALRRAARPETSRDQAADGSASTEVTMAVPGAVQNTEREQTEDPERARAKSLRLPAPVAPTAQATPPPSESSPMQPPVHVPAPAEELAAVAKAARGSTDPAPREPLSSAPAAPTPPQRSEPAPGAMVSPAAPSESAAGRLRSLRKDEATSAGAAAERPTGQSRSVPPGAPPPELRDRTARERDPARTERPAPVPLAAPPPPTSSAMRVVPSALVVGRLTVKDRPAADRELAELLSRVGGAETARRAETGGDTIDLVVPRSAYAAFAQGLARIGAWLPVTEPTDLPDRVLITLRITQ